MGARRSISLAALFGAAALMFHLLGVVEEAEESALAADNARRHAVWRHAATHGGVTPGAIRLPTGYVAPFDRVPNEVLMHFGAGADEADVSERLAAEGLALVEWSPRLGAARVGLQGRRLETLRGVAGLPVAEANAIARATAKPLQRRQRNAADAEPVLLDAEPLAANAEAPADADAEQQVVEAEVVPLLAPEDAVPSAAFPKFDAPATYIALLDTGADLDNENIDCPLVAGKDYVEDDGIPDDDHQHGTHLASIIDQVTHGTAKILVVKVLDSRAIGTEFNVARGIAYAVDQGVRVINLSLSFGSSYAPSATMRAALRAAHDAGVLIVAASGNDGEGRVAYPAALPDVMAVGAARPDGHPAAYSNYGAALDLLAPGGDEDAEAGGIEAESFLLNDPASCEKVTLSGTSMATAYAAAVAAVIRGGAPKLEPRQVRALMMGTAIRVGPAFSPERGAGVLDPDAALEKAVDTVGDAAALGTLLPTTVATMHAAIGRALFPPGCIDDGERQANEELCAWHAERARAVVLVEIFDDALSPVAGATVWVDVDGSSVDQGSCVTDAYGRCVVTSKYVDDSVSLPAVFATRAAKVVLEDGRISAPAPAQRLNASRAAEVTAAVAEMKRTPIVLAETDAQDAAAHSLFTGYRLLHSYQWRPVLFGDGGSDIAVAFNDAFFDQVHDALPVYVVEDGVGFVSAGDEDPLTWVNDTGADVLAEGEGLWGSGMSPQMSYPLWSFSLMYEPLAGGAGLWGSGLVLDFSGTAWLFDAMDPSVDFGAGGVGLWGSGWLPWSYVDYTFQTAGGLSLAAEPVDDHEDHSHVEGGVH